MVVSCVGTAQAYTGLYVFGDSLSDTGNNALAIDQQGAALFIPPGTLRTALPTVSNDFVATFPYRSSSLTPGVTLDRYTNGTVWLEPFAAALGLSGGVVPGLVGGTNFSFGGARVSVDPPPTGFPFSLRTQAATYLLNLPGGAADPNALYVVAGGGNDARDALGSAIAGTIQGNGNVIDAAVLPAIQSTIAAAAQSYATGIGEIVGALKQVGAGDVFVWNVPDLGIIPETLIAGAAYTSTPFAPTYAQLGTTLSMAMNTALEQALTGAPGVKIFDLFDVLQDAVAGGSFANVTAACAAGAACIAGTAGDYLFWDGIHPTSAGHAMLAQAMLAAVPEPETYALMTVGLLLVGWAARRRARAAAV